MADGAGVLLGGALFSPWLAWWGTWAALATAAALPPRRARSGTPSRFDVVVPAHDEEATVARLLESLRAQTRPDLLSTILVVADHCGDDTAGVAARAGADVLVRDGGGAGKPPSLREGVDRLRARRERGDAVVLLDADCTVAPDFLAALDDAMAPDVSVLQAAYTLHEPSDTAVRGGLRRGFALRNVVRARGATRLRLPVLLFGSGIVLRWEALEVVSFGDPRLTGTGDTRPVADDTLMALELLAAGIHPRLAEGASVVAPTPADDRGLGAQRLRWEAGQALMWRRLPDVASRLVRRRDGRGLLSLVDWTAPPLAASVLGFAIATASTGAAALAGVVPATVLVAPAAAASLLAAYLAVGVGQLEGVDGVLRTALGAPKFLAWKASLYARHRRARRAATSG